MSLDSRASESSDIHPLPLILDLSASVLSGPNILKIRLGPRYIKARKAYLINMLLHILISSINHPLLVLGGYPHWLSKLNTSFIAKLAHFAKIRGALNCIIVRKRLWSKIRKFEPAARIQSFLGLLKKVRKVFHRAGKVPCMNKIKRFREVPKVPWRLKVIDLKVTIWWCPSYIVSH